MFLYRRCSFVLLAYYFHTPEFTPFQVLINVGLSVLYVLYLVHYHPILSKDKMRLVTINEINFLVLCYHQICFTDIVTSASAKYMMGWSFCFFSMLNFLWPNLYTVVA